MASGARGPLLLGAPARLVRGPPGGFSKRNAAARPLHARGLHGALPQTLRATSRQQTGAPRGAAARIHAASAPTLFNPAAAAAAAAVAAAAAADTAAAAARGSSSTATVEIGECLAPLLAAEDCAAARVAAVKDCLAAFSVAAAAAETAGAAGAAGLSAEVFTYDLRHPAFSRLLKAAIPATPAAAAVAASPAAAALGISQQQLQQLQQQQQMWYSEMGSPFHVLLLQALRAAALLAEGPTSSSSSSNTGSSSSSSVGLEAVAAEVAASWQLQVNKDLRRLRLKAEAFVHPQAHGEAAAASTTAAAAAAAAAESATAADGPSFFLEKVEEVEAAATRLLCSAAEAAALLAEMQLRHSVRDLVPTLLLILERVRLSRPTPQQQQQQKQQQQLEPLLLEGDTRPLSAGFPSAAAAGTAAAEAARAGVQCLHALGRCQLFSEQLLGIVSADHLPAMEPDSLALYLFEAGRMGLRCKRRIDVCVERAAAAASQMSPPSLLLAAAGMYRFCVDCRPFYQEAAPRLVTLLPEMDFYQLRLMLRIVKHLDPSSKEASMSLLARQAASRLQAMVPLLQPQQLCWYCCCCCRYRCCCSADFAAQWDPAPLVVAVSVAVHCVPPPATAALPLLLHSYCCCIATFVERRCLDTPKEFFSLTRALVSALEETEPSRGLGRGEATAAAEAAAAAPPAAPPAAAAAATAADVDDPLALVHPVHDLVDVVDCLASHGLQSSLLPRIEAILAARYAGLDAPLFLLACHCPGISPLTSLKQQSSTSISSSSSSGSSNSGSSNSGSSNSGSSSSGSSSSGSSSSGSWLCGFGMVQMWCRSVEAEPTLFKSLRDIVTCVYPLAAAVYIHPVLFQRAARFVESRFSSSTSSRRLGAVGGGGLYPSERHLESFYLSHIAWSFLVADMQSRPFFVRILDRALAAAQPRLPSSSAKEETVPSARRGKGGRPSRAAVVADAATAATVNEDSSNSSSSRKDDSLFALPWRVQDAAWFVPAARKPEGEGGAEGAAAATTTTAATATATATAVNGAAVVSSMSLSPLDVISYRSHCEPMALLQQVCSLLQLESPQVVKSLSQVDAFEALAGPLIRWKAERQRETQRFLEEVRAAAAAAGLEYKDSREGGGPPSPAPHWGHHWPLSEVSLWIERVPLVLQTEAEGMLLHAPSSPTQQQRLYNTGFKYLLLRAFKALGQPKALFLDADEWRAASGSPQQQQDLLRRKAALEDFFFFLGVEGRRPERVTAAAFFPAASASLSPPTAPPLQATGWLRPTQRLLPLPPALLLPPRLC
ncbi:hypothetical protein Emed_003544 [Eimeria media]